MAFMPPRRSCLAALLFSYYVTWIVAASRRCEAFQLGASASAAVPSIVDQGAKKKKKTSSSSPRIQPQTLSSSSPQWSHLRAIVDGKDDGDSTTNGGSTSIQQVGIAGAGAVAFATAAILSKNGHDVMLWSPSGKGTFELLSCRGDDDDDDDDGNDGHDDNTAALLPLTATGALLQDDDDDHEYEFVPRIAHSAQQLVEDNDVIMVCLPANGHKQVFDALAPYLANSGRKRNNEQQQQQQHVIISSHASLGALYLMQEMDKYRRQQKQQPHDHDRERIRRQQQHDDDESSLSTSSSSSSALPTITAWGTTVCTARRTSGTSVDVKSIRQSVDWCTLPERDSSTALAVCETLFPCTHFSPRDGLLAISLSNLNPQNHLGMALGNISRMDKGEAWYQFQMTTPTIGRFLQDLDQERLNIAAALGLDVKTIYEHFSLSFHVPIITESISDMCQDIYESGNDVYGPNTPNSRYITEDVPFGLVLTAALGRLVGRPAVLHESGIMICNSMYGCDFVAKNDLLQALKLDEMSLVDLQQAVRTGSRIRGTSSHELLASTASSLK